MVSGGGNRRGVAFSALPLHGATCLGFWSNYERSTLFQLKINKAEGDISYRTPDADLKKYNSFSLAFSYQVSRQKRRPFDRQFFAAADIALPYP